MRPLYQELPFHRASYINVYKEELPHFIVPWHYHPEVEIMYILEGTGTRFVGDHVEEYEEGDLCLIGSNLPHEWRNHDVFFHKESKLKASCWCLFFLKDIFGVNMLNLPEMSNIRNLLSRSNRGVKFVGKSKEVITERILEYINETGAFRIAKLISLLECMATTDEYETLASVGFVRNTIDSGDFERFNKVYQFIMRNFSRPIRLEEVASLASLTPNAFCRYFRERTKKTFVQYLNDVRIGHAKKLLIEGKSTIATLSIESGFNNLSNFIDQFKRSTKMSPSEYQKKYGGKQNRY
ncbi:AraC-like DNA-binding protein [Arcticibacter tournemirensis]|uniref:AraC family transcriptional regulator n=1 Tax=Arcticibacter tournemirensis TaxID=699437 RepID=A0A5M9H870_9SPHI|nr:AraC family transcriptional regulator [Arcticibacter tournemirensis]KAA8483142.1 AraC family transcriptional regulator [Arcticibacter tournemirensis]TQM51942.1 AraC-like DNA-binding protein [Arcticibacter tournemirensis]